MSSKRRATPPVDYTDAKEYHILNECAYLQSLLKDNPNDHDSIYERFNRGQILPLPCVFILSVGGGSETTIHNVYRAAHYYVHIVQRVGSCNVCYNHTDLRTIVSRSTILANISEAVSYLNRQLASAIDNDDIDECDVNEELNRLKNDQAYE